VSDHNPEGYAPREAVDKGTLSRSVRWTGLVKGASQIATFGTAIFVLRFMSPEDYGLLSMAFAVMTIVDSVIDFGFAAALVQKKTVSESEYSACFWLICGVTLAVVALLLVGADLLGMLFNNARMTDPLRATALAFLATPVQVVYRAHYTRQFQLDYLAKLDFVGLFLRCGISIAGAVAGFGMWSLIVGFVGEKILVAILLLAFGRPVPVARFRVAEVRELIGYGVKFTLARIVHGLFLRLDAFVVGRLLGADVLGLISLAQQFVGTIIQLIGTTAIKIAFPLFSAYQGTSRLLQALYTAERLTMLIAFASLAGVALVASDLVSVTMGARWVGAVPYIQILALTGFLNMFATLVPQLLNAIGRSGINLIINLMALVLASGALYGAVKWRGIDGLAMGLLAVAAIRTLIVLWMAKRIVPALSLGVLLRDGAGIGLTVLAMAATVKLVQWQAQDLDEWWRLGLAASTGIVTYIAINLLLFRKQTLAAYRMMRT
jgi:teichuronic acid exporter